MIAAAEIAPLLWFIGALIWFLARQEEQANEASRPLTSFAFTCVGGSLALWIGLALFPFTNFRDDRRLFAVIMVVCLAGILSGLRGRPRTSIPIALAAIVVVINWTLMAFPGPM